MSESGGKKDPKKPPAESGAMGLWLAGVAGSGLVVAAGGGLAYLSWKAKSDTAVFMEFIDGYDKGEFFIVLAIIGIVSALVGIFGAAVCYLASNAKKFKRIRFMVLAFVGWGVGLVILLLVSFWLTYSAAGSLDLVFKPGFTASLVKYSKEKKIKVSIDTLQRELLCCGNYNHTEWFTVSWSDTASRTETSIPESCCDVATAQSRRIACVSSVPFGETIQLTVNKRGCVKALVEYYGSALIMRGAVMIGIAIVEGGVVVVVVMEYMKYGRLETEAKEKAEKKKLEEAAAATAAAAAEAAAGEKEETDATTGDAATPVLAPPGGASYGAGYGAVPGMGNPYAGGMYYGQ